MDATRAAGAAVSPPRRSPLGRQIGRRIRGERTRRGLRVRDVADRVPCSENEVRRAELGYHTPSTRTLYRLAEAMGSTVHALLPEERDGEK